MDMLNILKNFDAAGKGDKPSASGAAKNDMKAILESFNRIEECGEMPMAVQGGMPEKQGNPVTMNINLTASGKENVDDLMALVRAAGIGDSAPAEMPGQEMDMAAMRAAIMGPGKEPEMDSDDEDFVIQQGKDEEGDDEDDMEEWANSPDGVEGDEEYQDHEYMTRDLSGGINREKPRKAIRVKDPAVESVKQRLWAALNEKKTTEGKYKSDAQRKAVHANKDKMKK